MNPRDWFVSDADLARLFATLRGQARASAAEAVNGAADAAVAQMPRLGDAARRELDAAIRMARVHLNETVDEQKAHAIRIIAEVSPELRSQVNDIAHQAGASASGGAIDEANRRGSALAASSVPWVVGGALLLAAVAVAAGAMLGSAHNRLAERA